MSNLTPFIVAVLTLLVMASPLWSLVGAANYQSDLADNLTREEMKQSFYKPRGSTPQTDQPSEQAVQIKTETIIDYVEPAPEGFSAFADNCGDGTNQFSTDGVHWEGFPVTYAVDPANSGVDPTTTINAVVASFNEFDKYMPDNSFTLISDYNAAEIKVRWAFLDGPLGQVGQASYSYSLPDMELISATITLDSGDNWFVASVERCTASGSLIDIESVASHELGHGVGLGHVSDQLQTMYPTTFAGATLQRSLGNGDRAGLTNLYFDWSSFQSLGGLLKSDPAVALNSDGRLQVFAVATDNQLWFRSQTTAGSATWSAWTSLGGNIKGNPAVALNSDGRLQVFAVATDNQLWFRSQTTAGSATWSAWTSLGGNIKGNPAVALNSDGRLQVFAVAVDNQLWFRSQTTTGSATWSAWTSLGGNIKGNPAVGVNSDGRLQVFAVAVDNQLYFKSQTTAGSATWSSAWTSLGGNIKGNPAVGVNSDGRLQVFAVAVDNQLYFKSQTTAGSATWSSAWTSLGGNLKGDPAVARNLDGRLEVFVVAADNGLYRKWQSSPGSTTWSAAWTSLGGIIKSNPAVGVNSDGRLQVFVVATDNGLYNRWQLTPPFF